MRITRSVTNREMFQNATLALTPGDKRIVDYYLANQDSLSLLPQAGAGKTTVYLLNKPNVVLKNSGSPQNQARFDQMKSIGMLCKNLDLSHLIVPKAFVQGPFIIEERLPVRQTRFELFVIQEQMALYLSDLESWTIPIQEFATLCTKMYVSDLSDEFQVSEFPNILSSSMLFGRYDNVSLIKRDGRNEIALIDLERFTPMPRCADRELVQWNLAHCIALFPHHFEEIYTIFEAQFPHFFAEDKQEWKEWQKEAFKVFVLLVQAHGECINDNEISYDEPCKFEVKRARMREILHVLLQKVYLGDAMNILEFAHVRFPLIMDAIVSFIRQELEKANGGKAPVRNLGELIALRSLYFDQSVLFDKVSHCLNRYMGLCLCQRQLLTEAVLNTIFTEMNGAEINYSCLEVGKISC